MGMSVEVLGDVHCVRAPAHNCHTAIHPSRRIPRQRSRRQDFAADLALSHARYEASVCRPFHGTNSIVRIRAGLRKHRAAMRAAQLKEFRLGRLRQLVNTRKSHRQSGAAKHNSIPTETEAHEMPRDVVNELAHVMIGDVLAMAQLEARWCQQSVAIALCPQSHGLNILNLNTTAAQCINTALAARLQEHGPMTEKHTDDECKDAFLLLLCFRKPPTPPWACARRIGAGSSTMHPAMPCLRLHAGWHCCVIRARGPMASSTLDVLDGSLRLLCASVIALRLLCCCFDACSPRWRWGTKEDALTSHKPSLNCTRT